MARKLDRLSQTLDKLLKARGFEGRLHQYRIFGHWERTVGGMIARHAQPQQVRGNKLALVVDSPAWMQQLSLLKPEIIAKLNKSLGREAIKDITLKLGEIAVDHEHVPDEPDPPPLDPHERATIEQYVGKIADAATRDAIRRVIEKDFRNRKKTKK
ncbi:MAG: DUF721 domain-containing protein [Nitrospiraceae bacterium]|nr:DUF721 domain-containing protein [Nitrospiraceae bacterium]